MKILVTGGAGYIGSVTTEMLVESGHDVVVFDNLFQGHRAAVHPGATFVQGDLADKSQIDAMFDSHPGIEAVMHFAAYSLVGESMRNPFKYLDCNVTNALRLLESMDAHNVRKFILSSTANLFDDPESIPITEKERIVPGSPYGESKSIIERFLYWLDKTDRIRYAALRYFNAAGASETRGEDHSPETHLIPLVLQVALGQLEKLEIFGEDYPTVDGTCVRDYIHIKDLAQAHILALGALDKGSRKYNLGNGAGYSVKQVIEAARKITGHAIPADVVGRRPGDPATLIAGADTIKRELGWTPQYPDIESIVETAWNWHKNHPNGYGDR